MSPEAKKALTHRIVMIAGEEEYLRRQFLTEIITEATGGEDFDLENFEAGVDSPDTWFGSAGTAPFLSERRVAVVRHILRSDPPATLPDKLPETALVILVADEELGDDQKQRKFGSTRTAWSKLVGNTKGFEIAPKTDSKNLVELLRKESTLRNKKLSASAASAIVEMSGGSLSRSLEELDKLALYTGAEETIREEDVREVVMPSREWNIFKLLDAVLNNQAPEALRQMRILLGSPQKMEETAQRNVLPQLSRQMRLLWQARQCIEANVTIDNIPESIARTFPDRPNLAKEKDYTQRKAFTAARKLSFPQIGQCFRLIADADARVKGLLPAYSAFETLETTLLRMIDVCHPAVRR